MVVVSIALSGPEGLVDQQSAGCQAAGDQAGQAVAVEEPEDNDQVIRLRQRQEAVQVGGDQSGCDPVSLRQLRGDCQCVDRNVDRVDLPATCRHPDGILAQAAGQLE